MGSVGCNDDGVIGKAPVVGSGYGTVRYVPKGSRDDLFGEVVRRDISADSERVAACGLDLIDDDLRLLLIQAT